MDPHIEVKIIERIDRWMDQTMDDGSNDGWSDRFCSSHWRWFWPIVRFLRSIALFIPDLPAPSSDVGELRHFFVECGRPSRGPIEHAVVPTRPQRQRRLRLLLAATRDIDHDESSSSSTSSSSCCRRSIRRTFSPRIAATGRSRESNRRTYWTTGSTISPTTARSCRPHTAAAFAFAFAFASIRPSSNGNPKSWRS
jgi:hypothetical protein